MPTRFVLTMSNLKGILGLFDKKNKSILGLQVKRAADYKLNKFQIGLLGILWRGEMEIIEMP